MIRLARIALYPFKSLDPVVLDAVSVRRSGMLQDDRRYAVRDREGAFVNGKRDPRVHRIRSEFDVASRELALRVEQSSERRTFHVDRDRTAIEDWFSTYFETPAAVAENSETGFPDDLDHPGPTVVSTATLQTVASWFGGWPLDEVRRRFRANFEIDGVEPFWEDRLFGPAGTVVRFSIGDAAFEGTNPCARCVVPSRSPVSGDVQSMFQKVFAEQRRRSLPDWADARRFDHFYHLAVNTRPVSETLPARIRVGDLLRIDGPRPV